MTPENRVDVLPRFFHRSKQEARAVSAEIAPREDVPVREVVTPLRPPKQVVNVATFNREAIETCSHPVQPLNLIAPKAVDLAGEVALVPRRDFSQPVTGELSRLHLTASRELLAKLEAARLALSHARPGATLADVIEAGVDLVLARDAKKKALVARPRATGAANEASVNTECVPAAARREVWTRDRGCCQAARVGRRLRIADEGGAGSRGPEGQRWSEHVTTA